MLAVNLNKLILKERKYNMAWIYKEGNCDEI